MNNDLYGRVSFVQGNSEFIQNRTDIQTQQSGASCFITPESTNTSRGDALFLLLTFLWIFYWR
jgi:hypothetical protein